MYMYMYMYTYIYIYIHIYIYIYICRYFPPRGGASQGSARTSYNYIHITCSYHVQTTYILLLHINLTYSSYNSSWRSLSR